MKLNQFACQPCDHKWYEHRNPDPAARLLGLVMMVVGTASIAIGLAELGLHF